MTEARFTFALMLMAAALCMHAGAGIARAAEVLLTQDGQPRAAVVIQAESEQAKKAGETIVEHIRLMSGAELPMIVEGEAMPEGTTNRVLVGHTKAAAAHGVKIPSGYDTTPRPDAFEEEGFVIKTVGNDIVVAGNQDGPYRGTRYGAGRLLEKLGCRWYFPGDYGRIVPEKKTVAVPEMDITEKPDFAVRHIGLGGWLPVSREERAEYDEWATLVGMNIDPMYPLVGDGFLAFLIPHEEYFEKRPDLFGMNEKGERVIGRIPNTTMLEFGNPDVLKLSIQHLKEIWAGERKPFRNVEDHGVGISPPDGTPVSHSPESKALNQNFNFPRYVHKPSNSEEFFAFARDLAKAFPDKWVSTMAYASREFPPQGVELPKNVMVMYAPISCDVLHPNDSHLWRRADFLKLLTQWTKRVDHVTIYDYSPGFLTGMFVPERDAANMAVNAPIYRDLGVKGMHREGRKAFMITWLSFYCTGKFLWDADTDLDALKTEFYRDFFGPEAGPHVRAWWDACEERLVETDFQAHEDFLVNHIYTLEFARSIRPHIEKALASKTTPKQRERLEAMVIIADHFEAFGELTEAEAKMDYPAAAAAATKMWECKLALEKIWPYYVGNWTNTKRPFFAEGRAVEFEQLAAKRDGTVGRNLGDLPRIMAFRRDVYNEGMAGEWYLPDLDDSGWDTRDSFFVWEQQEPVETERGHDYDGLGWYRTSLKLGDVKPGERVMLRLGGIMNEGWVWVNGQYAGHKDHKLWWAHANTLELDVTDLVKPGQENTVAVRILNDAEFGGLYRRGFFYATTPEAAAEKK